MLVLSKVLRKKFFGERITPTVSLMIAAHNEEKAITAKLENPLALHYPRDKLEIIVALSPGTSGGVASRGSQKRG